MYTIIILYGGGGGQEEGTLGPMGGREGNYCVNNSLFIFVNILRV
jgi:hypothetical protein